MFFMETRISLKGQITLPAEARKKFGIKTGDVLKVRITEDGILVLPGKTGLNNNQANALETLRKTSGIWKDMEETGENFVRRLRAEDAERWKVLGIE
ncbi:regulators of stationary/sporulation gene expression [Pelotomaculum thermopropionicum SI]|uniref:Regulators of stationary/sporulation gene expression n=1 Tax=Pelotomaculum thermopropionicum (strain DSM 13744 / JCM 10971 / SI) TaxID=370438 RepID=A5D5A4_PELTS|nr:regulators of stationary/sporulation gene expression [Pelotomaculum thermopropionicum SI]